MKKKMLQIPVDYDTYKKLKIIKITNDSKDWPDFMKKVSNKKIKW